ncbi:MAG: hypothetical protein HC927_09325 [Deltaproteobacteria bacterium]|nr:hypothetical protein [Deltaproteobacteria bacterium]
MLAVIEEEPMPSAVFRVHELVDEGARSRARGRAYSRLRVGDELSFHAESGRIIPVRVEAITTYGRSVDFLDPVYTGDVLLVASGGKPSGSGMLVRNSNPTMQRIVGLLIERSIAAYQRAQADLGRIHDECWDDEEREDIRGELEVASTEIAGLASCFETRGYLDAEQLELLRSLRVFMDPRIGGWVAEKGERFSAYADYAASVEVLRLALLEVFADSAASRSTSD